MTGSAETDLPRTLETLKAASPGIRAVFLSSSSGGMLGSSQLSGMEKVHLAGVSAASMAIANKAALDLHLGALNRVQMMAEDGCLLLLKVGSKAILSVLLGPEAAPETVLSAAKLTAERLDRFV